MDAFVNTGRQSRTNPRSRGSISGWPTTFP